MSPVPPAVRELLLAGYDAVEVIDAGVAVRLGARLRLIDAAVRAEERGDLVPLRELVSRLQAEVSRQAQDKRRAAEAELAAIQRKQAEVDAMFAAGEIFRFEHEAMCVDLHHRRRAARRAIRLLPTEVET